MIIDLRSDTITKPTPGMLEAMMKAKVGDDVFGEDTSVNELEEMGASMFGMEAALYCASGTMSNQIAIKIHTQPGDEVICERSAHVYQYECGGIAFNSGSQVKLIEGNNGKLTSGQISSAINPEDVHKAKTSLVCLENSSNRGGGSCYDFEEIKKIRKVCDDKHLRLHLDGARLFNALIAKNENPEQYGKIFDSLSVCLNKGLGCPIGSLLLGSREFVSRGRRIRKVFGGGMRQAGYMAATGIYALQNNINRLAEDHMHAKKIAEALQEKEFVGCILPVETNIIIFEIKPPHQPKQIAEKLKSKNILVIPISATQIRMVLHLDISEKMVEQTVKVIKDL